MYTYDIYTNVYYLCIHVIINVFNYFFIKDVFYNIRGVNILYRIN